jgi:DNA-binding transcriptional MocR family regulator
VVPRARYSDLSHGGLEADLYPSEELKQCAMRALDKVSGDALSYFSSGAPHEMLFGDQGLRERIADLIVTRDRVDRPTSGILLVNGATQGLALIVSAFVDPGDGVVMECVSTTHAQSCFAAAGAVTMTVPIDERGMDVAAVESSLVAMAGRRVKPKLIYTIPTFHVPTGVLMWLQRREQLMSLAREWNVLIVEDNCQYELYYETPPPPTLQSLDDEGRVVQLESFSRTLAPALRIGWVSANPAIIESLARVREDSGVSLWLARTVEQYIAEGKLGSQLERVRAAGRHKRDYALAVLEQYCGAWTKCSVPQGGAYLWIELSRRVDWERVRARLARQGLICRPGERVGTDGQAREFLRFGFLQAPDTDLDRWFNALGRAIATCVKH